MQKKKTLKKEEQEYLGMFRDVPMSGSIELKHKERANIWCGPQLLY